MIGPPDCRQTREALGVYVLGAIDPAERAVVDEHLAMCAECREELASLAGLPSLLRRIPNTEAERLLLAGPDDQADAAPPELLHALLTRAWGVKRTQRWRRLAAAAAVAAFALGGGAALANLVSPGSGSPSHHPSWASIVSVTNRATATTLTVKGEPEPGGTRMDIQAVGVPPGDTCRFMVGDSSGNWWPAGSWQSEGYSGWFSASVAVPWHDVRSYELMAGGHVLAQVSAKRA